MNTVACQVVLVGAVAFLAVVSTALSEPLTQMLVTPDELTWNTGSTGNQAVGDRRRCR